MTFLTFSLEYVTHLGLWLKSASWSFEFSIIKSCYRTVNLTVNRSAMLCIYRSPTGNQEDPRVGHATSKSFKIRANFIIRATIIKIVWNWWGEYWPLALCPKGILADWTFDWQLSFDQWKSAAFNQQFDRRHLQAIQHRTSFPLMVSDLPWPFWLQRDGRLKLKVILKLPSLLPFPHHLACFLTHHYCWGRESIGILSWLT